MRSSAQIVEELRSFDFEVLRESLRACPPPEGGETALEAMIDETLSMILRRSDYVASIVQEIDDETDTAMALAIQYVELKSRWIGLNTKINYETFRKGCCDIGDMLRATATSTFLGHLETMIASDDIDKITEFLAEPINKAA